MHTSLMKAPHRLRRPSSITVLVFCLSLLCDIGAEARTHAFAEYGFSVEIADSVWQVSSERGQISDGLGEQLLTAIGANSGVTVIAIAGHKESGKSDEEHLSEIIEGFEESGGAVRDKAVVTLAGPTAYTLKGTIPVTETESRRAYIVLIPGDQYVYGLVAVGIQPDGDPAQDPSVQAVIDGFRLTGAPIVKPAAVRESSARKLGYTLGQLLIPGAIILTVVLVLRARRRRREASTRENL